MGSNRVSQVANLSVNRIARELRLRVPSALRIGRRGYLKR